MHPGFALAEQQNGVNMRASGNTQRNQFHGTAQVPRPEGATAKRPGPPQAAASSRWVRAAMLTSGRSCIDNRSSDVTRWSPTVPDATSSTRCAICRSTALPCSPPHATVRRLQGIGNPWGPTFVGSSQSKPWPFLSQALETHGSNPPAFLEWAPAALA